MQLLTSMTPLSQAPNTTGSPNDTRVAFIRNTPGLLNNSGAALIRNTPGSLNDTGVALTRKKAEMVSVGR